MDETQMFGKGAADRREDFLKPGAWRHEEISAAFTPAIWKEKKPEEFTTYPKRNQEGRSNCVLYTKSKALAVDELSENGKYRELAPRSLYPFVVVPGGGSNSLVAAKLAVKQGMTLEHLLPDSGLSEEAATKADDYVTDAKQVALVYKPDSFVECLNDFETIASILQAYTAQGKKKVVELTVIGKANGTWNSPFPVAPKAGDAGFWYHRIPICDFGLINGVKHLSFDNSWGENIGLKGQQFLKEDYIPWTYGALYNLNLPDNWQQLLPSQIPPPKHTWSTDMSLGSAGPEILALQIALQSMGFFPVSSVVSPTGSFGGITKAAVVLFQAAFGIDQTGKVGPITRAKLNSIFG